jgi:hypothetical protein
MGGDFLNRASTQTKGGLYTATATSATSWQVSDVAECKRRLQVLSFFQSYLHFFCNIWTQTLSELLLHLLHMLHGFSYTKICIGYRWQPGRKKVTKWRVARLALVAVADFSIFSNRPRIR